MRLAQILHGKAHWIFETEQTMEEFKARVCPSNVYVEVGPDVQEGWDWDGEKAIPPIPPDPMPGIRAQRNRLLVESDFTRLDDVPLSTEQKAAWKSYRQQLRDFPTTCDPNNPVWPEKPV